MSDLTHEIATPLDPRMPSARPRADEGEREHLLAPEIFAQLLAALLEDCLGADAAWILHREPDGRVSFLSPGSHDGQRVRLWIPPSTPVARAFETGHPILFDDYACGRFRECTASGWNGLEARSLLLVPLPSPQGGSPWAVELASRRSGAFSSEDPSWLQDLLVDAVGRDTCLTRSVPMLDACRSVAKLYASMSGGLCAPAERAGGTADLAEELSHDVNNGLAVLASNIGNLVRTVEDLVGAVTRAKAMLYMAQLDEDDGDASAHTELRRGIEMALEVLDGCETREMAADAMEIASDAKSAVARITASVDRVVRSDEASPNQTPEAVRLDDEVGKLVQLVSRALPRASCALSVQPPPEALPTLLRPRQLVQAALLSLLHSAVAATARPGSPRPGSIVVRSYVEDGAVCVGVLDNGALEQDDAEEDELSLVAPPRLAAGPSRPGLEEAREAVEALGGSLRVESVPGTGTLATLSVPLA